MTIEPLRQQWERLGSDDPLWAVLTEGSLDGGAWTVEEFLATGVRDIQRHLQVLDEVEVDYARGRALDFGCGAGRLTQALAETFERVDGVDIAASMIERAREINRRGERCVFHVNTRPDLSLFDDSTFDLVFSMIVLQHMEPRFALGYIREFVRILKPGGIALFQVPAAPASPVPEPLPADAWRADLMVEDPPARLPAREPVELRVRVRNASAAPWAAGQQLGIGAHWRMTDGTLEKIGDGRTPLPDALAPGAEVVLPLVVTPPNVAGRRVLEVDVVQEWIAWFRERGSQPFQHTLDITGGAQPAEPSPGRTGAENEPWIDMHCVPLAEVTAFVEVAGGEVAHALPDISAGDAYEGYLYVVRRAAVPDSHAALRRVAAALAAISDREDMLPPLDSKRSGRAREAELWLKRNIARGTRWATMAQTSHDHAVKAALAEVEAALLVQEREIRALRAELERRAREESEIGETADPAA